MSWLWSNWSAKDIVLGLLVATIVAFSRQIWRFLVRRFRKAHRYRAAREQARNLAKDLRNKLVEYFRLLSNLVSYYDADLGVEVPLIADVDRLYDMNTSIGSMFSALDTQIDKLIAMGSKNLARMTKYELIKEALKPLSDRPFFLSFLWHDFWGNKHVVSRDDISAGKRRARYTRGELETARELYLNRETIFGGLDSI